jgi:alpha-L-arabinofuranosidase
MFKGNIEVFFDEVINKVSKYTTGACLEDVDHEIYGGLYSQMIFGESFEEPYLSIDQNLGALSGLDGEISCLEERSSLNNGYKIRSWQPFKKGSATGSFAVRGIFSRVFNGHQSQEIIFVSGSGEIGIENKGLDRKGMSFVKDKLYEGFIWVVVQKPTDIFISLENHDGSIVYAEKKILVTNLDWDRLDFKLKPDKTENNGRFAIKLKQKGLILLGYVFLQPGQWGRYKNLPVRKDIVEGLIKGGITVLRYGGATIVPPDYRWKNMIGPRSRRMSYRGYRALAPYSTHGWGIIDFLDLCEAAGFEGVPVFNIEETTKDMEDFIDYIKGGSESEWGEKRINMGHKKPYKLKYIGIGNEDRIDEYYWIRFKRLAEAIWKKTKDITLIVGDDLFAYPLHIKNPFNLESNWIDTMKVHRKILDLATKYKVPVWFDAHVVDGNLRDFDLKADTINTRILDYIYWLGKISPDSDYKVVVLEKNTMNARSHSVRRALSHAYATNVLQRLEHGIPIICTANCLQPYRENNDGVGQGMLFFTSSQVLGQPPYYVTQMITNNLLTYCVKTKFESQNNALDVTALKSEDNKFIVLQVVNLEPYEVETTIKLNGFKPKKSKAEITELKGKLEDLNTINSPDTIVPIKKCWTYTTNKKNIKAYTFPPYSFTILRFE